MDNNTINDVVSTLKDEVNYGDGRPHTIPALREWQAGSTPYLFGNNTRILLDQASSTNLAEIAGVLAEDIQRLHGFILPIIVDSPAQPGDIVLRLDPTDTTPTAEGYTLESAEYVLIRARTAHGVFNGTRSLLQLLKQDSTIPGGIARDWPAYPQRSLMVDMGRKYFSLPWLEKHIRDLAYLKYNYFHFHISDNHGFRLESERHPEIVSPEYYTKEQIRALIELARRHFITIVPEIDMPGHMDTILDAHPDLQLVSAEGKRHTGDIDLSNPASYKLMQDLLEEYIPLFPGPYWHLGADEYIMLAKYEDYPQLQTYAQQQYGPAASPKDTYLGFVNWANEIVEAHGKIMRAWNDGLYGGVEVTIADDIIYEHWYRSELAPGELLDMGLSLVNGHADYLYYVLTHQTGWRAHPDAIYNTFEPHLFHGNATIEPYHPLNLGAKLHVWCDYPMLETEDQIAEGIVHPLRALSQKNWGSPRLVPDYAEFQPIIERIGHAPGH